MAFPPTRGDNIPNYFNCLIKVYHALQGTHDRTLSMSAEKMSRVRVAFCPLTFYWVTFCPDDILFVTCCPSSIVGYYRPIHVYKIFGTLRPITVFQKIF